MVESSRRGHQWRWVEQWDLCSRSGCIGSGSERNQNKRLTIEAFSKPSFEFVSAPHHRLLVYSRGPDRRAAAPTLRTSFLSIGRSPELYIVRYTRISLISKLFPVSLSWCMQRQNKTHPPVCGLLLAANHCKHSNILMWEYFESILMVHKFFLKYL